MTIDFTKPLICEDRPDIEVLAVYNVNYSNMDFKHAVHVRYNSNSAAESIVPVKDNGLADGFKFRLTNKKPTVVKEVWQNVYVDETWPERVYVSNCLFKSEIECNMNIDKMEATRHNVAQVVSKVFSDGTVTQEFIQIKKD
jgi:hypothetical protein